MLNYLEMGLKIATDPKSLETKPGETMNHFAQQMVGATLTVAGAAALVESGRLENALNRPTTPISQNLDVALQDV